MTEFFIFASLLAAGVAVLLIWPLMAGRGAGEDRDSADAKLYRDQLAEVERDTERGLISPSEAEGAKAEIARRLLAAARRAEQAGGRPGPAPRRLSSYAMIAALVAAPLLSAAVYLGIGSPGRTDLPLAARDSASGPVLAEARPSQREAEAEAAARDRAADTDGPRLPTGEDPELAPLIAQLQGVVAERPNDAEGHRLLAGVLMRQDRFAEAWPVIDRLIEIEGNAAPPDLYAAQAEAMVLAAGGYVSPEAEAVIVATLQRNPEHPMARYYAGLALAQSGRVEQALALWRRLAAESPPDAPWLPVVQGMMAELERQAGPMAAAGGDAGRVPQPDSDAVAAVQSMSPEERMEFMRDRVAALETELTESQGEPQPERWVQLIRSLQVLGEAEEAQRVYALSQERLQGSAASFVRQEALVLGVIDE
ncbi:MAG: c-type cytochrome biogenesis protein CcmI [Pseudomonadota bacterium]